MSTQGRTDAADVLLEFSHSWGYALAFGIISLATGVLVLVWPGHTIVALAVLFGIQLIISGLVRFVAAFAAQDETGPTRVLYAVLGALSLVVGLYAVRHLFVTVASLALILGMFLIISGVVDVFVGVAERGLPRRGWTIAMGVLSVVAGLITFSYPGITLLALAAVVGVWFIVVGAAQIATAFQLRSMGHTARAAFAGAA